MIVARSCCLAFCVLVLSVPAAGQERGTAVDLTFGYAGFVDEATDHFFVAGGAVRHYITPHVSIGPEFVLMFNDDEFRNRVVMLTGNVVYDFVPLNPASGVRATPFVVGGLGGFWVRESFPSGSFWGKDPAFTAGGGVRGRLNDRISAAAEYRIGWELHQRITGTITIDLR
jgi:hypothetical protein